MRQAITTKAMKSHRGAVASRALRAAALGTLAMFVTGSGFATVGRPSVARSDRAYTLAPPQVHDLSRAQIDEAHQELVTHIGKPSQDALIEEAPEIAVEELDYPTFDNKGKTIKPTTWRVIGGTGNGSESYLATTSNGTIYDFGGDWLHQSRDEGRTWQRVVPPSPLKDLLGAYAAEGAVAVAPGGDIVGAAWFAQEGDTVLPFKYDAEKNKWSYNVTKLHHPFFDRPTISAIPGPFNVAGQEVPYLVLLRGGAGGMKTTFYSFDGLEYFLPKNRALETLASVPSSGPLEITRSADLDWIQPDGQSGITPLGAGRALASAGTISPVNEDVAGNSVLDPATMRWSTHEFPEGGPPAPDPVAILMGVPGRTLTDSDGFLHHFSINEDGKEIIYMISNDGGKTWTTKRFDLPNGYEATNYYKSARTLGSERTSVLALHTIESQEPLITRDLVFKFTYVSGEPELSRVYQLGFGIYGSLTPQQTSPGKFDFTSVGLLPDGRVVVAFQDEGHPDATVAVEKAPHDPADIFSPGRQMTYKYQWMGSLVGVGTKELFRIPTATAETEIQVTAQDESSIPVLVRITQTHPNNSAPVTDHAFCTDEPDAAEPLPIQGGLEVGIFISPCGRAATKGTLEITVLRDDGL